MSVSGSRERSLDIGLKICMGIARYVVGAVIMSVWLLGLGCGVLCPTMEIGGGPVTEQCCGTVTSDLLGQPAECRSFTPNGFMPEERNLLILHGWIGTLPPMDGCLGQLIGALRPIYDNVVGCQYPSGEDIGANSAWLRDELDRQCPSCRFDIVGYSEGGVLARYATEQSGGFGERVDNLVTIATPHEGFDKAHMIAETLSRLFCPVNPDYIALQQMRPGSSFLSSLNDPDRPNRAKRYRVIAGVKILPSGLALDNDGVVPILSALGSGVISVSTGDAAILWGVVHSKSVSGRADAASMPCDGQVYEVLREWLAPGN